MLLLLKGTRNPPAEAVLWIRSSVKLRTSLGMFETRNTSTVQWEWNALLVKNTYFNFRIRRTMVWLGGDKTDDNENGGKIPSFSSCCRTTAHRGKRILANLKHLFKQTVQGPRRQTGFFYDFVILIWIYLDI